MEAEVVLSEMRGHVMWLTINRLDARNALSPEVISKLFEHLGRCENDANVRAIVLTGAGDKAFSAGGSLQLPDDESGFLGGHDGRRAYGQLLLRFQQCTRPVVACVNGYALAGGLGLVLGCDLAIASDDAKLGLPEIDVGLFPYQVVAILSRHVGRKRALELALTARKLTATEAQEWGLLNRVVPRQKLYAEAQSLAEELAGKSPAVIKLGKRAFYAAEDAPLPVAMDHLASQLSLNAMLEDAAEGVTAFFEKRKPVWKGR